MKTSLSIKIRRKVSLIFVGTMLISSSLNVFAANRDYHTKDKNTQYLYTDWSNNNQKYEELLGAIIGSPIELLYEFNGQLYDYAKLSQVINNSNDPSDAFIDALENEDLIYEDDNEDNFKVIDIS